MEVNSCFLYRFPGSDTVVSASASLVSDAMLPEKGFIIREFLPDSNLSIIPFEHKYIPGTIDRMVENCMLQEYNDTSKEEYFQEVNTIIEAENKGAVQKVVAARNSIHDGKINIEESFYRLCKLYPDAFVFTFFTPKSGCWIGASPELLLKTDGNTIESVALAGTRNVNTNKPWDNKNLKEQDVVARYIIDAFQSEGLSPVIDGPLTQSAGKVEHLKSIISSEASLSNGQILDFATKLSPTPALCGIPRNKAIQIIAKCEKFPRKYYGGFCGLLSDKSIQLYVIIRCANVFNNGLILYGGGGIMPDSNPEDEWQETERKLQTLLSAIDD